MAIQYRIHPAIGIARVGDAPASSYFIGPETPGLPSKGPPPGTPVPPFKVGGKIKPQAARFRVWAYTDIGGKWRPDHEVVPGRDGVAAIKWTVHLANRKAAFFRFNGRNGEDSASGPHPTRNPGPAATLTINPGPRSISGTSVSGVTFTPSGAAGETWPVNTAGVRVISYLGELRTDSQGALIVIGGKGVSASRTPGAPVTDYANNANWFDDISDGPVTAEISFSSPLPGPPPAAGPPLPPAVATGAWVLVGPPDFAPELNTVVTLYDLLLDMAARKLTLPKNEAAFDGPLQYVRDLNKELRGGSRELKKFKPEFNRDVYPILASAATVFWVYGSAKNKHVAVNELQDLTVWDFLSKPPAAGSDPAASTRQSVFAALRPPPGFPIPAGGSRMMPKLLGDDIVSGGPNKFLTLTPTQYVILKRWADGQFIRVGPTPPPPPPASITPEGLDRAALEHCVGGALCPGIEVGWQIRAPSIFAMPFRIRHGANSAHKWDLAPTKVEAGYFSRQMAVPWQADFRQCYKESHPPTVGAPSQEFGWWPQQRPTHVWTAAAGGAVSAAPSLWHRATGGTWGGGGGTAPSNQEMVLHWSKLGFVLKRGATFVEDERASAVP
jgi:hypothetical protein